ncbi:MAG: type II toxin-antitoxin system RelE/ParE family toxin [Methyloversatilis sp.]|nr:type II toxin-antitoxin system RelE/ParE family toxin [Methyloversatilis sp.]
MPRLIWSQAALWDVQRHYRFLASASPDAARRAIKAIRDEVKVLTLQPAVGRPVDDLPDEFREWVVDFGDSGYVVRYHIGMDVVTLLAVRHQKEVGF